MEPTAERPSISVVNIINKTKAHFSTLPEDLNPKQAFLETWFNYFQQIATSENLNGNDLAQALSEFSIANVFKQWITDQNLNDSQKPLLKDSNYLRNSGIDPARLVRYLVLQMAYPKGINHDNERITFELDSQKIVNLLNGIKQTIPQMKNLTTDQLVDILTSLGFKDNPNSESYINPVNQDGFQAMLREIINTHSS